MANSRVCKILNVAEKNDAAREISKIMGGGRMQRREGYSKFNKIYEFDFNILGKEAHMIMTSVSGHLLQLDFVLAYKNWNSCAPEALFTADVQYYCPDDYVPIKRTLEREVRGCQHLILWTDGDREGENIADEIVQVVTQVKSRGLTVHRARFSEITFQSIMAACRNLRQLDQRVSDAVKVRRELDLRIGSTFTRFQTKYLQNSFPSVLSDQLVSYGPCQFPTLGFVVERYNQIQAFISETFYKIKVTHQKDGERVQFSWKRVRLFHHTACLVLYQLCLEDPTAHVIGTTSRPRSKWRPLPMDTVELEKLASRKLRISAKETMKMAEKLYTQGLISYPRTETNIFPDSFDLSAIVQQQTSDPQWGEFASRLLTAGTTPRQGSKTDNAHPPIHPTKYTNTLQGNEKRLYELVVRHFLACCSQDAKGQETKVEIDVGGEKFTAEGLMILARNYLEVYPYDKWSAKVIPVYETNSSFQPTSIEMVDGETTAPPLLQEADLIGLMEKHGIGTDATHADHIETIKTRNYVGVQPDGGFVPGELGMGLVEGYDSMGYELSKPQLRAELESDLKRICEGTLSKEEVLSETINKYKQVFLNAKGQASHLQHSLSKFFGPSQQVAEEEATPTLSEAVRKCPHCQQSNLVIKKKRDGGFMLSCLGYPQCRAVQFFPKCVIGAELHESSCDTCQPQPVHKVLFGLKEGAVPPYVDLTLVACTTCDHTLKEDLAFPPIKITNPTTSGGTFSSTSVAMSTGGRGTRRTRSAAAGRRTAVGRVRGGRGRGSGGGSSGSGGPSQGRGSGSARGRGKGRGARGDDDDDDWPTTSLANQRPPPSSWTMPSNSHTSPSGWQAAQPPPANPFHHSAHGAGPSLDCSAHNPVTCSCGENAVLLTVRKEDSVNKGRQFYKCPRQADAGGCNFFLWADDQTASTSSHVTSNSSHGSSTSSYQPGFLMAPGRRGGANRQGSSSSNRSSGRGGAKVSVVICSCGDEAIERTVQKEGPNKGKQFFVCAKPRDQQCQFFEWSSNLPETSIRSYSAPRGGRGAGRRGRGRGASRGSGSWKSSLASEDDDMDVGGGRRKRAPPTCSVCKEVGHTKRSCPLNQ